MPDIISHFAGVITIGKLLFYQRAKTFPKLGNSIAILVQLYRTPAIFQCEQIPENGTTAHLQLLFQFSNSHTCLAQHSNHFIRHTKRLLKKPTVNILTTRAQL